MLSLRHSSDNGETRLYIRVERGEAWIAPRAGRSTGEICDWLLWVRATPSVPATTTKTPVRLAIESRLRAWLLRRYHRCLFTLRFDELCAIAEREATLAHNQYPSS
jgi:hypothetical protein